MWIIPGSLKNVSFYIAKALYITSPLIYKCKTERAVVFPGLPERSCFVSSRTNEAWFPRDSNSLSPKSCPYPLTTIAPVSPCLVFPLPRTQTSLWLTDQLAATKGQWWSCSAGSSSPETLLYISLLLPLSELHKSFWTFIFETWTSISYLMKAGHKCKSL